MNRQILLGILGGVSLLATQSAWATATPAALAQQKQNSGNVTSYVQKVDNSRNMVRVDGVDYVLSPSTVVHDGNAIVPASSIKPGSRIKVDAATKAGQKASAAKEVWIFQKPSTK